MQISKALQFPKPFGRPWFNLALLALGCGVVSGCGEDGAIVGSGRLQSVVREIEPVVAVEVTGSDPRFWLFCDASTQVSVVYGEKSFVELNADANLIPLIKINVIEKTLHVAVPSRVTSSHPIEVVVQLKRAEPDNTGAVVSSLATSAEGCASVAWDLGRK
jgi:hypothetical protein